MGGIKVPFTREEAKKCICGECPVQAESQCIKKNAEKLGDVLTTKFFQPDVVPGLYCSSGVASCKDIDASKSCICGACQVYQDHRLASGEVTTHHFCNNGIAK
ncbi:MAG: DUF2769 domain-containing protein [Fibrobacter sp.]|nr:DUF2769 domain-containing protein [Fibrobacter sp.]